jgi:hypothetical protein
MIVYEEITSLHPSLALKKHGFSQDDGRYYWAKDFASDGWRLITEQQFLYVNKEEEPLIKSWTIGELGEYLPPRLYVGHSMFVLQLDRYHDMWLYYYESLDSQEAADIHSDDVNFMKNEADARADLIDHIPTNGYINLERLSKN